MEINIEKATIVKKSSKYQIILLCQVWRFKTLKWVSGNSNIGSDSQKVRPSSETRPIIDQMKYRFLLYPNYEPIQWFAPNFKIKYAE